VHWRALRFPRGGLCTTVVAAAAAALAADEEDGPIGHFVVVDRGSLVERLTDRRSGRGQRPL